jgi:hypothetical protein
MCCKNVSGGPRDDELPHPKQNSKEVMQDDPPKKKK